MQYRLKTMVVIKLAIGFELISFFNLEHANGGSLTKLSLGWAMFFVILTEKFTIYLFGRSENSVWF